MTGLRASHARTCAHAFAYLRAAEPVPSLLSSLLDVSGRIQGFAREKGLFRGLFRLCRFFLFFQKITSHTPLCCSCCMRLPLSAKQSCNRAATVPSDAAACVCLCQPHLELQLQRSGQLQVHRSASVSCSCIALPLSAAPCIRATYTLSHPTHSLLAPSIHSALVLCLSVNTEYQTYMYISIYIY